MYFCTAWMLGIRRSCDRAVSLWILSDTDGLGRCQQGKKYGWPGQLCIGFSGYRFLVLLGTHFKICSNIGCISECRSIPSRVCVDKRSEGTEFLSDRIFYTESDRWSSTWFYLAVCFFQSSGQFRREHGLGNLFRLLAGRSG